MEWQHVGVILVWCGFGYMTAAVVGRMTQTLDDELRVLTPAEVADILIRELEDEASKRYPTQT